MAKYRHGKTIVHTSHNGRLFSNVLVACSYHRQEMRTKRYHCKNTGSSVTGCGVSQGLPAFDLHKFPVLHKCLHGWGLLYSQSKQSIVAKNLILKQEHLNYYVVVIHILYIHVKLCCFITLKAWNYIYT